MISKAAERYLNHLHACKNPRIKIKLSVSNMQFVYFSINLLPLVSAHRGQKKKCLSADPAAALLTRYFAAWTASDAATVPALVYDVVTEDLTYADEKLNSALGACEAPLEGPIVFSRDDFVGTAQHNHLWSNYPIREVPSPRYRDRMRQALRAPAGKRQSDRKHLTRYVSDMHSGSYT